MCSGGIACAGGFGKALAEWIANGILMAFLRCMPFLVSSAFTCHAIGCRGTPF